jgi:hypothetical protein
MPAGEITVRDMAVQFAVWITFEGRLARTAAVHPEQRHGDLSGYSRSRDPQRTYAAPTGTAWSGKGGPKPE